jgi:hypothetical protein
MFALASSRERKSQIMSRSITANSILLSFVCLTFVTAGHAEIPSRDSMVQEFTKRWNAAPDVFFKNRDTDPKLDSCRKVLKEVMAEYVRLSRLEKPDFALMENLLLTEEHPLTKKFKNTGEPLSLVELVDKCGPCVARVDKRNGTFYDSYVWCRATKTGPAEAAKLLPATKDYLLTLSHYEKDFNYIVNFRGVDKDNQLTEGEEFNPVKESPFTAFIAVRASFPGLKNMALGYYGDCPFKYADKESVPHFNLRFSTSNREGLPPQETTTDAYKSGITYDVSGIDKVSGGWFADAEGNLAYNTAADFSSINFNGAGFDLDLTQFLKKIENMSTYAKRVIMDSGLTVLAKQYPKEVE